LQSIGYAYSNLMCFSPQRIALHRELLCLLAAVFAGTLLFFSTAVYAAGPAPKNPNSAKSCAICHYRWIDTFFIDGRGTELAAYQSEKVVATRKMCMSCHDGSVLDSRSRMTAGSGHKTGLDPPAYMNIPKIFPLDANGQVRCATCHTAHGVPSGADVRGTIFMRTSNQNSAMCRRCHADKTGDDRGSHHPLGAAAQGIPRQLLDGYAKAGNGKNVVICESCHTAHGSSTGGGFLVAGTGSSELCLACHPDKNSLTPDGKKRSVHIVNARPATVNIPDAVIRAGAKLSERGGIICQTCHKIHHNRIEQKLLVIPQNKQSGFCLTCHSDKGYIADTRHNLRHSAPGEKNLAGQTVAEAGVCAACHLPHRAARKMTGSTDLASRLCLSCHNEKGIARKKVHRGASHPIGGRPDDKKAVPDLPLFGKRGSRTKGGKMSCATCHDPHRMQPYSTRNRSPRKADKIRIGRASFLRKPSPAICRECHLDKFQIAGSGHDLPKTAPQAKNILGQTAAESGLCGGCHLVHNAGPLFLWGRDTGLKGDHAVPEPCIGCHQTSGLAPEKIIQDYSHPVNIRPHDKGLDTTLPLFDHRGKTIADGLMTCRTCHDPHRWRQPKIEGREKPAGDGRKPHRFLRLDNAAAPKLCQDCHPQQAGVAGTDHDLRITAPSSPNIIGQIPSESGICGACHLVHNGQNTVLLWAREMDKGSQDMIEAMCNTCHSKTGAAHMKIAPIASHPEAKIVRARGSKQQWSAYFPVFDKTTGMRAIVGSISCPSCHNVHRWSPEPAKSQPQVNLEGDATSSFLRAWARQLPCKDCHGLDSLFRYQYFHDPTHRRKKAIGIPSK